MIEDIFQAIKNDDAEQFGALVQQRRAYFALSIGRFPLLSVCYLFHSRRIIKRYEAQLLDCEEYTRIESQSEYEIYSEFKKYARRGLRYYVAEDAVVTPFETLVAMGQYRNAELLYDKCKPNDNSLSNAAAMCRYDTGKSPYYFDNVAVMPRLPISKKRLVAVMTSLIVIVLILALTATGFGVIFNQFGTGTEENPYKLSTTQRLASANDNAHYMLTADLEASASVLASFSGILDGNGKTIRVDSTESIETFSGTIKNVRFELGEIQREVEGDYSILCKENKGVFSGCTFVYTCTLTEKSTPSEDDEVASPEARLSLFGTNSGTLEGCIVEAQAIVSSQGANVYFAALTAVNKGTVDGCSVADGSVISADTVDIAALVVDNAKGATIKNSTTRAEVSQTSANPNWYPNAAGVLLKNEGIVQDTQNFGAVTVASTQTTYVRSVLAGGIAVNNVGTMLRCKNMGNVTATAENCHIYLGGVVANNYQNALVDSCGSEALLTGYEKYPQLSVLIGGIIAQDEGKIVNSFSLNTYYTEYSLLSMITIYLGGVVAVETNVFEENLNNWYLSDPTAQIRPYSGVALLIYENVRYSISDEQAFTNAVATADELRQQEVYR